MSKLQMIKSLYEYNEWANNELLHAASRVSEEELAREIGGSFGSIQGNLLHILGSHVSWLMRWTGKPPELAKVEPGRVMPAIRQSYNWAHDRLREFVGSLDESALEQVVSFMDPREGAWHTWQRPLWQVLLSVGTHGGHHRAEVAMALTSLGYAPGELDYSQFCWRRSST